MSECRSTSRWGSWTEGHRTVVVLDRYLTAQKKCLQLYRVGK